MDQSEKQQTFVQWLLANNFSILLGSGSQTLKKAEHHTQEGESIILEFIDDKQWRIDEEGEQWPLFERKWRGHSILGAYLDSILSVEVDAMSGRSLNFISVDYFENDPYMRTLLANENFAVQDSDFFMGSKIEMITIYKVIEGFLVRDQMVTRNTFADDF